MCPNHILVRRDGSITGSSRVPFLRQTNCGPSHPERVFGDKSSIVLDILIRNCLDAVDLVMRGRSHCFGGRGGLDCADSEVPGTEPETFQALQESETRRWTAVIARPGLRAAE